MKRLAQQCNRREVWLLLLSLGLLWAVFSPPQALVSRYHAWKACQAIATADQATRDGDWHLAVNAAQHGLRWAPQSFRLHYLLITSAAAQEKAIDPALLEHTFLHPSADIEQRAALLAIALDAGDQVTFSRLYNALTMEARRLPKIVIQRMRLSLQLGRHEEVAELFEQLDESERNSTSRQLRISAHIQAQSYHEAQQGMARFLDIAASDQSIDCWPMLRLINDIPVESLDRSVLETAIRWIRTARDTAVEDRLIADRIEFSGLDKAERLVFLERIITLHRKSSPAAVGRWLISLGFADMALSMTELSPECANQDIGAYETRLAALCATNRWQEAWQWLEDPPKGGHVVMQWLARAKVAHQLDRHSDRRQSIARAIDSAVIVSSENNFFIISETAHLLDEDELAALATMKGLQVSSTIAPPAPFFLPTLRYLWQQDRLEDFRKLNRQLLIREPGDLQRNNDELYLSLLLDENPKLQDIIAVGRKLVATSPDNLSFATTLAWALLRSDRASLAAEVLDNPQLDWSQAGPADLLVRDLSYPRAKRESYGQDGITPQIDVRQLCRAEQEQLLKAWQAHQAGPDESEGSQVRHSKTVSENQDRQL